MNLPTASNLPRVMKCPASQVLPQSADVTSRAASEGHARHKRIADVLMGRAPKDSIPWPVHEILGIEDGDTVAVERAWRLRVSTGQVEWLGDELDRAYPPRVVPEDEIDGTADAVVYKADGTRVLADWKGRSGADAVRANWQLRTLALMAVADIVAVVPLDGDEYGIDATELSASDHAATEATLRDLPRRLVAIDERRALGPLGRGNVTPGDHCRYCRAKGACPAYVDTARELDTTPSVLDRARAELATAEGVGKWYEWIQRARAVVAEIDTAIRDRLTEGPGVLPDGRTIALATSYPRKLDGRIALRVLRERYGDEADSAASVSVSGAERVAKGHAPKGQGAAEVRALTAALAEAGAIGTDSARVTIVVSEKGGE